MCRNHAPRRTSCLTELGDFLAALRVNGVPVGPADIDRLRQLFALEPQLDRDNLKSMLSALLVKTPAQRAVFEALFGSWCPDHAADWPEEDNRDPDASGQHRVHHRLYCHPRNHPEETTPRTTTTSHGQASAHRSARRSRRRWITVVAGGRQTLSSKSLSVDPVPLPARLSTDDSGPDDLPATPVDKVWFWQAEVNPDQVHVPMAAQPARTGIARAGGAGTGCWRPGGAMASAFLRSSRRRGGIWAMAGSRYRHQRATTVR